MTLQRLYSLLRQAIEDYEMIGPHDHVAIGISGGKDSLALLCGLSGLRRFLPASFCLTAITVDLGYDHTDYSAIRSLCESLDVPYHIVPTRIKDMLGENTCSLCARLRKGALAAKARELGCQKIAYAHNMDDVVETMMLSLIYEGRFSTFLPVTHFEDSGLDIIRPMIYVPAADVIGFRNKYHLPVIQSPCPYDKTTQRTYVRHLLEEINRHAPGVTKRLMRAIRSEYADGSQT